ncbi:alkaline phosphatase [Melaminivora suipulveris]|uniref:Alkaline phosphatase n=1 Tax=Melaminivora suipulveris TaxID=2109913 RepID=A0A2R3Q923_9BURK|nr:alkaline phosphatase D family protein [Melaminivora suipulveris]AVO48278.1 alkaline phosphatase [Melaminivora suipulveris]
MTMLDRRALLTKAAWAALAAPAALGGCASPAPLRHDPFRLGVASGDPLPDGMVLWTRLMGAPAAGADAAPLPGAEPIAVRWEVAEDAHFRRIAQRGVATALPELAHSVHVEVRGLAPGRWYHYRFLLGDAVSPPARTRTAPAPHELPGHLRLVHASCQRWEHGHYAAWRHVCAERPDLVVFLGDYVYEYPSPPDATGLARTHTLPLARTLADWRERYALHKSDPLLQAAHACAPWLVTWDDHEVQNDYAGTHGRGEPGDFLQLRAAAWQAFYEHMPLRAGTLAASGFGQLQLYRRQPWGRLAHLHVLDTRQWRDLQACRAPDGPARAVRPSACPELLQPGRTLLGTPQERWLREGLALDANSQPVRFSVLAQQTLFAPRHYPSGVQSTDSWDGYPAARTRLLQDIADIAPRNTVLLGGDIHQNYVCNVETQVAGRTRVVASEFCGTSVTSRSGTTQDKVDAIRRLNPHVLLARCEERGYCVSDVTPQRWTATLRAVRDPLDATSDAWDLARFVVEDGRPGPQPA